MRKTILPVFVSLLAAVTFLGLVKAAQEADLKAAAEIHKKQCFRCHGEGGEGDGPASKLLKVKPADWTDPVRMGELTDEQLFEVIKNGGQALGGSAQMPGFAAKLKDDQIAQLIVFIKSLRKPAQ